MANYSIFFKRSVRKNLQPLPKKDVIRIINRIRLLAYDPRPPGCEKLSGKEQYRLRQGVYRILYSIQDTELTVWVIKIAHRREVYR